MKTTVSSEGQIELPIELRAQDGIEPGQQFEVERVRTGQYLLRKVGEAETPGLIEWLRSCPGDDWFRPMPSESTDTLGKAWE